VRRQLDTLHFSPPMHGTNPVAVQLAKLLAELAPGDLSVVKFQCGGAEVTEAAIKLARQYHRLTGAPGKNKVISRYLSWHGSTLGALSASGLKGRKTVNEPLAPGFLNVFPPTCYRCPFGKRYPDCGITCATLVNTCRRRPVRGLVGQGRTPLLVQQAQELHNATGVASEGIVGGADGDHQAARPLRLVGVEAGDEAGPVGQPTAGLAGEQVLLPQRALELAGPGLGPVPLADLLEAGPARLLVVDQRQQLLGGVRVALLDGGQNAGHFTHRRRPKVCNGQVGVRDTAAEYTARQYPRLRLLRRTQSVHQRQRIRRLKV
jgi:hypothetical protein